MDVQSNHEAGVMCSPGVIGIGRNEATGELTLEICVESAAAIARQILPRSLEGVRVQVVESGEFVAF